ncbi:MULTISPECIES: transcription termination/antitermination protein NusG [unclassified Corynebacterium]|uniref:Transcription termination/antitermination protein NusG n=1 Tax=Corynebacterium aurimucosum TaxID=169292 RepID=A0A558GJH0_9CORY|nr:MULTISPECIES: transcription termination/antitermination protein NusG [unclassified Corynebacterium]TVU57019.1 transcription termination/antitermination protein NusG [Corynebacterium aurimucosum]MDK6814453.1 transcription termination/antitermination protein NusG [Corynebacterium sp. UMB6689]OFL19458.1 transcription termination/antitermination protein NusG [Corynebacterium sp. HMSC062A03]OFS38099.1 transcription termination/antitermination protein NusG [Corynebacterium sp. HMSC069E04]OFT64173
MSEENTGTSLEQAMIDNVQEQAAEAVEATEESQQPQEELSAEEKEAAEKEAATKAAEAALGGVTDEAEGEGAGEVSASAEADAAAAADAEYKSRLRAFTRELKKQPGQWYIIQCYSGYENKVKTNLDMRAQTLEVEDSIFEVVVPVEQAIEKKDGKKKVVKRKLLPGYVLVRMELNDAAWSVVRDTPGVTSFVGNEGNATPVKIRDVAKFLMPNDPTVSPEDSAADSEGEQVVAMPEKEAAKAYAHDFEVGEAVTILSGPLASVSATISEIDPETGKMQGLVSIFGRETPVELSPTEIERIS